ncbi:MAG TPA: 2-C-methyl-D-erythritol 2,4-cyclodiphosphate synthase [candidate division Zixibacteria bacterium]|nr:2-C-methyl-D-erythritol 2,4-cyclodiphosphate synthase [candidate division Zixibacteria bacterium]
MRAGIGFDIHRLVEGRKLILGGIEVPYHKGLLGHSDGDVVIHAIIDAVLGAAALGDIGTHFPDTSDEFRGISSVKLLRSTIRMLEDKGLGVKNIDATIIAEEPKLLPYIPDMREVLAKEIGIEKDRVSIKAKTSEGLGVIGERNAIACLAIALVS